MVDQAISHYEVIEKIGQAPGVDELADWPIHLPANFEIMRLFFRPMHFVLLAGSLLLFAWNSFVGLASPQASSQADSISPFEALSQIVQADSIRIKDEWETYRSLLF